MDFILLTAIFIIFQMAVIVKLIKHLTNVTLSLIYFIVSAAFYGKLNALRRFYGHKYSFV